MQTQPSTKSFYFPKPTPPHACCKTCFFRKNANLHSNYHTAIEMQNDNRSMQLFRQQSLATISWPTKIIWMLNADTAIDETVLLSKTHATTCMLQKMFFFEKMQIYTPTTTLPSKCTTTTDRCICFANKVSPPSVVPQK